MFRRDRVDRVITNLKTHFELINNDNYNMNKKRYTWKIAITKLSECIKQIYELLYGTVDTDPQPKNICKLIPKLIDPNDNFFHKLCLYRTYFSFETQTDLSKILKFIIENGGKYGNFGISKYIKNQYDPHNKHNKIIDALLNNFEQHSGGIFSVLQAMTKRSDLTSMFLKLKIKSPSMKHYNKKSDSKHHKSYSVSNTVNSNWKYLTASKTNYGINYKNNFTQMDTIELKHYKNNTAPSLESKAVNAIVMEQKQQHSDNKETDVKDDISFVEGLFILVKWPSLHISLDAFKTLKYLFSYTNNKQEQNEKLTAYFYDNSDLLFCELNALINSENTINKRQCFLLLKDILTKENNFDVLLKYITSKHNLSISKRILTDEFIKSHHDQHNHNAIIDALLEDYFQDAADILMEIASRSALSDLLLNNTFITRLQENEMDINDIKMSDISISSMISKTTSGSQSGSQSGSSHKNLSNYFGVTSEIKLPHLNNMDSVASVASYISDECQIISPGGTSTRRNRYSGEDMPCFKRSPVNHFSNNNGDVMERPFVMELISLINRSCSDLVAIYSFNVLRLLLSANKQYVSKYLEKNYKELIEKFRELIKIENENKVRQKEFLGLLCDLLLQRKNSKFRKQFISQVVNLKIIMNLLKCKSDTIKYDAFHIFAIFVTTNFKNREVHVILWKNTKHNNLIKFIENLMSHNSKKYHDLGEEKKIVIEYLKKLPTPKTDKSYKKIPMESLTI